MDLQILRLGNYNYKPKMKLTHYKGINVGYVRTYSRQDCQEVYEIIKLKRSKPLQRISTLEMKKNKNETKLAYMHIA